MRTRAPGGAWGRRALGALAGASFAALLLASIIHTFNYKRDFYIPASEVKATEEARTLQLARHV